jgi:hypothetical protein
MDVFVLACLIATAPETQAQKDLVAKCHQIYTTQSTCLEEAERLKLAFDYAENTRSEGTFAGCIRTMVTEGQSINRP